MKNAGFFLLSLTMAVGLSGCDIANSAAETADRLDRAHQFGKASRESDPADPEGGIHVLRVESKSPASWFDAMAALRDADLYCEGGGDYVDLGHAPDFDPRTETQDRPIVHPAGTTFEQRIRCKVEFPHEIRLGADVTHEQAMDRMERELAGAGLPDPDRVMLMSTMYSDRFPKYASVAKALGRILTRGQQVCRWKGVAFHQTVVMSTPTATHDDEAPLNGSRAYVGVEFQCLDGLPPEALE